MSHVHRLELPPPGEARNLPSHEELARRLEETGDYRIARRLRPPPVEPIVRQRGLSLGVYVDVETTGLDPLADEIIEIAVLPFTFTRQGDIVAVHPPFCGLRQPSRPIPAATRELTGIDDDMVRGHLLSSCDLPDCLGFASLVVAHNASFDRAFLERSFAVFRRLPWGCSQVDVGWRDEGIRSTGLEALAARFGFFHDAHRAVDDCHAGVAILRETLPRAGVTALRALIDRAMRPTCRVWTQDAPYGDRDALKAAGYAWNNGSAGGPKAWYRDVDKAAVDAELARLETSVFSRRVDVRAFEIDPYDRHSPRVWRCSGAR